MSLIGQSKTIVCVVVFCCLATVLQFSAQIRFNHQIISSHSQSLQCSGALAKLWNSVILNYFPANREELMNATITEGCVQHFQKAMQARHGRNHGTTAIGIRIKENTIHLPPNLDYDIHLHGWLQDMLQLLQRSLTNCPLPSNHSELVFVLSTSDWPISSKASFPIPVPVLGTVTTQAHWDVPVPGSVLWTWKSQVSSRNWRSKQDLAFFRGSATCASSYKDMLQCPRVIAWKHAQQFPVDVDVGITNNISIVARGQVPARSALIAEHERYRYLLTFDGNSYARRFTEIMGLGSTVLKAISVQGYEEFFYSLLQQWVHFVPFECTLSQCDIAAVVRELRKSPDSAEAIAQNLQTFRERYLSPASLDTYWHMLLLHLLRVREEQAWASAWDSVIVPRVS